MVEKINGVFKEILDSSVEMGSSDIHLTVNLPPTVRVDGVLRQLDKFGINNAETTESFVKQLLSEEKLVELEREKEVDTSMTYGSVRFRVHIFKQSGANAIVLRIIPSVIPRFKDMGIPGVIKTFTTIPNGLILITGVTGSGKSTTLAALINEINENYSKHIVTVEDPIEFVHKHKNSIINQREIGTDVKNFPNAVRAAMREDPDVLLIGEMRDLETIQNAITMAETGHLVFGTLHTKSAAESIGRIIDIFPPEQQSQIRTQLASSIKGIVSQNLLPKIGGGRVACCEVMVTNDAIKSMIRENQNTNAIVDQIQMTSSSLGGQTHLQSLAELVASKKIEVSTAREGLTEKEINTLNAMIVSKSKMNSYNYD